MKPHHTLASILALALLLATGCASHPKATGGTGPSGWWKAGVTDPQEIVQALARCRVVAAGAAPGTWRPKNPFAAAAQTRY